MFLAIPHQTTRFCHSIANAISEGSRQSFGTDRLSGFWSPKHFGHCMSWCRWCSQCFVFGAPDPIFNRVCYWSFLFSVWHLSGYCLLSHQCPPQFLSDRCSFQSGGLAHCPAPTFLEHSFCALEIILLGIWDKKRCFIPCTHWPFSISLHIAACKSINYLQFAFSLETRLNS